MNLFKLKIISLAVKNIGIFNMPYFYSSPKKQGCLAQSGVDCESKGRWFEPWSGHILSLRFGHEKISTTILTLPLIQEGQLSVTGERMGTKYW